MQSYGLIVEGEPKGKGRPRFTRHGQVYTPNETREYEERIRKAYEGPKFEDAVYVKIIAYYQMPKKAKSFFPMKKPDLDNIAKIILDSLNGVAYDDDKQVVRLLVVKYWTTDYPRVEIRLNEWGE